MVSQVFDCEHDGILSMDLAPACVAWPNESGDIIWDRIMFIPLFTTGVLYILSVVQYLLHQGVNSTWICLVGDV